MLPQPIPFITYENENPTINSKALDILSSSKRPNLIIIYGKTQTGKTSFLNHLISGPSGDYFCNKEGAFEDQPTKNVNIIGPFKIKDLQERLKIKSINDNENDLFFIDTEGTALPSENISLLTLLQVSIISIYVNEDIPYGSSMQNVLENIEYSSYIKKIFPTISDKEICQPILLITLKDIPNKFKNDSNRMKEYIQSQTEKTREKILSFGNGFDISKLLSVIVIPEYVSNDENDNIELEFYWKRINKIFKQITMQILDKENVLNGQLLCEMIKVLFTMFNDLNDSNQQIEQINSSFKTNFEENSRQMITEYINDLKLDYNKCIKFINDKSFAREGINKCIQQNEIYKKLIPNAIEEFVTNIQNEVKVWIEGKLEELEANVLSEQSIKNYFEPIKNQIIKNQINDEMIEDMWDKEKQKNVILFETFEKSYNDKYEALRNKFIDKVKREIYNFKEMKMRNKNKIFSYIESEGIEINKEVSSFDLKFISNF